MPRTEPIGLENSRGERLAGVLHRPEGGTPGAAVVVAHGMLSSKDSPKHQRLCERLAAAGVLALRFDFTGRGESEGDPEDLRVSQEVADLGAALATVRSLGPDRIAAVGSSLGGAVAILTAASDPDLTALVTIACPSRLPSQPRASWGHGRHADTGRAVEVAPGVWIRSAFFADARRHDVVAAATRVACPWRIIHGRRDEVVPVVSASELAAARPPAELLLHPDADHRFSDPAHRDWLVGAVVEFVSRQLGNRQAS